ncbi:MAG: DNA-processing protein DprA [Candidatus Cloacimonadales bacterium]|nr:DNA-processing protein DprA [Candidatus Cloacimonadota bacterium]MDY0381330.1 DNA-processing protein DprA [Candidatus Cloacimonadaceae bacterium]MCB5256084.1 DNA-processing protein DprA [Candidatus Cloacimonadota bacterium]MCB5264422.1 DNA-processing protein DprA [Candidatus Cloacimonadota bacterium]MCB5277106.1 DNA-processing protein DprA [Candidatus Cloacimonadota bacterium]
MNTEHYQSWLCLKTTPKLGFRQCMEILNYYPDPTEFVGKKNHPLYMDKSVDPESIAHLQAGTLPKNFPQIQNLMRHYDIHCLNIHEYPSRLRDIYAAPLILYYRGELACLQKDKNLAVVGTRHPTAYGREMCIKLISPICRQKVNIISGLAMGIDAVAHQSALKEGTTTVAVMACGLEKIYPPQNRELADRVIANGILISEYEPGTKPDRWNFPARNRIISALSQLVFVVEGHINSGALLTAKNAIQQNRDVCAMPGNINNRNAEGPNHLIKNGAALINCPEDLQFNLGLTPENEAQIELDCILSSDEQLVCDLLKKEQKALAFDEILVLTHFSVGKLSTVLTNLELKGLLAKEGGSSFFLV